MRYINCVPERLSGKRWGCFTSTLEPARKPTIKCSETATVPTSADRWSPCLSPAPGPHQSLWNWAAAKHRQIGLE